MRSESDGSLKFQSFAPRTEETREGEAKCEGRLTRNGFGAGRVVLVHELQSRGSNVSVSVLRRTQSRTAAHLVVQLGCPLVIPVGQDNSKFVVVRVRLLLGVDDQGCSHAILIIDAGVRVVPVSSKSVRRSAVHILCAGVARAAETHQYVPCWRSTGTS